MPHIHEKIDFVVTAWIVNNDRVLLILHKKMKIWIAVGGHIELNEDPEAALFREVKEECGLDIEVIGEKPEDQGTSRFLLVPTYMNIHPIVNKEGHYHVAFEYFARAKSNEVKLADTEHDDIRWFTESELDEPKYNLIPSVKFLAKEALRKVK